MTTRSHDDERVATQESRDATPVAAAALMLTGAVLTFVVGVFALAAGGVVVSGPGYQYTFQITGWGWVNLLTALVMAAAAVALLMNVTGARVAAIIVSCLAIVATFVWMPYYPTGSIVLIAIDVVVVWGVATSTTSRGSS